MFETAKSNTKQNKKKTSWTSRDTRKDPQKPSMTKTYLVGFYHGA